MKKDNFFGNCLEYYKLIAKHSFSFLLMFVFILAGFDAPAQNSTSLVPKDTAIVYDEIHIQVLLMEYKSFYIDVLYTNTGLLYINIEDLFKFLNINCRSYKQGEHLNGFIENESRTYEIDYTAKQIMVGDKLFNSPNSLIKEMGVLYIESSSLSKAFGISMTLNYRSLVIQLKSNFELPIIKQQRIEKLRNNIAKLNGETITDTTIVRNYHLLKLGTIDWTLGSSQASNTIGQNNFGLGLGTELLYGETDISMNYYTGQKLNNSQLNYLWRWVDNDKSIIKQATIGRISPQAISSINSPVVGAEIRNSPTLARKATGYYIIHEITKPNWIVELYINNVLVNFTKADASGLFIFKVPIVYGYTILKLKFYGPLGEDHVNERTINVPYTIMPTKKLEYSLSAAIVQDNNLNRFLKSEFNYGINTILTFGGGFEYLSSNFNNSVIPYAKASLQPINQLTCYGEYVYGVRSRILLNYYFLKDNLLEIDYTKYKEGQLVTYNHSLEERKMKVSFPFRFKNISGNGLTEFTQYVYKTFTYNQENSSLSFNYRQMSTNLSTQLNFINSQLLNTITNLSLSYRLSNGFSLTPAVQYNVGVNKFVVYKITTEKRIPFGLISILYQNNNMDNDQLIALSFRYDLPFAKTNGTTSFYNGNVSISESAQGSLAFKENKKGLYINNNPAVSKGGIALYPFLDLNQNGVFDSNEHIVMINSPKILGGQPIFSKKDSIIRIPNLIEFSNYIIEFSDDNLENITWRFKNKKYQVLIDPNQFKRIDIPIISVGEVNGMVFLNQENSTKGIGRILVKFYTKSNSKVVAEVLSESDGYFSYMGLHQGDYFASIDSTQLSNLDLTTNPLKMEFSIKMLEEGDIVGDLNFVLVKKK